MNSERSDPLAPPDRPERKKDEMPDELARSGTTEIRDPQPAAVTDAGDQGDCAGTKKENHVSEIPRRCRLDLSTPAELAIRAAVDAVEALPADVRLTNAVILLGQAREAVADFVDGIHPSAVPDAGAPQERAGTK